MKRIVWLLGCCLACSSVSAQVAETADSIEEINGIKRDTTFLYAESTMRDGVEALSGANAVLELKVMDWVRNQYPSESVDTCVANAIKNRRNLYSKRGNYFRVLAFVNKNDIIPPTRLLELNPPQADVEAKEEQIQPLEDYTAHPLTPEEEAMAAITSFDSIEPYVKGLMSEQKVHAYGKYASLPEETDCYIFVYDRSGSVVAVLRQAEDGTHFNMQTEKIDDVKNYKNCGAIWFQLNKD